MSFTSAACQSAVSAMSAATTKCTSYISSSLEYLKCYCGDEVKNSYIAYDRDCGLSSAGASMMSSFNQICGTSSTSSPKASASAGSGSSSNSSGNSNSPGGDNTGLIIGIVVAIVVVVIAGLVALWFFKFRKSKAATASNPNPVQPPPIAQNYAMPPQPPVGQPPYMGQVQVPPQPYVPNYQPQPQYYGNVPPQQYNVQYQPPPTTNPASQKFITPENDSNMYVSPSQAPKLATTQAGENPSNQYISASVLPQPRAINESNAFVNNPPTSYTTTAASAISSQSTAYSHPASH